MQKKETVIDGSGMVLGRISSSVAKMLLNGEHVVLLNAEKLVISGHPKEIVAKYKRRFELQDKANPEHSPYWSKRPDIFVKRIVRGMLPFKRPKGKTAFKLLRAYVGVPEMYKGAELKEVKTKSHREIYETTTEVAKILEKL
jgi:large subunit ribosomal protein L13